MNILLLSANTMIFTGKDRPLGFAYRFLPFVDHRRNYS